MSNYNKQDFPVDNIRRFLEPSPLVLVSSKLKDQTNIMAMEWYTVMEFTPSLIGCVISSSNHSFELIKQSKECVLNLPTMELAKLAVKIGNCSGETVDKFKKFKLTIEEGEVVSAPLIKECYANFECKLYDAKLIRTYNYFIFEVVKARVAKSPKFPQTIHYRGDSLFIRSGKNIRIKSKL